MRDGILHHLCSSSRARTGSDDPSCHSPSRQVPALGFVSRRQCVGGRSDDGQCIDMEKDTYRMGSSVIHGLWSNPFIDRQLRERHNFSCRIWRISRLHKSADDETRRGRRTRSKPPDLSDAAARHSQPASNGKARQKRRQIKNMSSATRMSPSRAHSRIAFYCSMIRIAPSKGCDRGVCHRREQGIYLYSR